jgi:hypothetical protein
MALSLEAVAGPLSSYHLDSRLGTANGGSGGWLTLTASAGDSGTSPVQILQQQIHLEADRIRLALLKFLSF